MRGNQDAAAQRVWQPAIGAHGNPWPLGTSREESELWLPLRPLWGMKHRAGFSVKQLMLRGKGGPGPWKDSCCLAMRRQGNWGSGKDQRGSLRECEPMQDRQSYSRWHTAMGGPPHCSLAPDVKCMFAISMLVLHPHPTESQSF